MKIIYFSDVAGCWILGRFHYNIVLGTHIVNCRREPFICRLGFSKNRAPDYNKKEQ